MESKFCAQPMRSIARGTPVTQKPKPDINQWLCDRGRQIFLSRIRPVDHFCRRGVNLEAEV
jgi:hypothetical protein